MRVPLWKDEGELKSAKDFLAEQTVEDFLGEFRLSAALAAFINYGKDEEEYRRTDPLLAVAYLADLRGKPPYSIQELIDGINEDPGEEELSAHRVKEGVLVSQASDARWQLYTP